MNKVSLDRDMITRRVRVWQMRNSITDAQRAHRSPDHPRVCRLITSEISEESFFTCRTAIALERTTVIRSVTNSSCDFSPVSRYSNTVRKVRRQPHFVSDEGRARVSKTTITFICRTYFTRRERKLPCTDASRSKNAVFTLSPSIIPR